MNYNYTSESKKWQKWKSKEEQLLKKLGVDEKTIINLRDYDWTDFKSERRYRMHQSTVDDSFFNSFSTLAKKDASSVEDLLDEIENEALYTYLSSLDDDILNILFLKTIGYSVSEISKLTGLTSRQIYYKIKKIREKIFNDCQK